MCINEMLKMSQHVLNLLFCLYLSQFLTLLDVLGLILKGIIFTIKWLVRSRSVAVLISHDQSQSQSWLVICKSRLYPQVFDKGKGRVRVRVEIFQPLRNLYPWCGFWQVDHVTTLRCLLIIINIESSSFPQDQILSQWVSIRFFSFLAQKHHIFM